MGNHQNDIYCILRWGFFKGGKKLFLVAIGLRNKLKKKKIIISCFCFEVHFSMLNVPYET